MKKLQQCDHGISKQEKPGFWKQLGGGALTVAISIHLILAIGGGIWIAQRILAPEKNDPDFASGRPAGGGERSAQSQVDQKMRARITPPANMKRIVIGEPSTVSIMDPGTEFGDMASLSPLTSTGMSSGPGGPGNGDSSGNDKWGPSMVSGDASGPLFRMLPLNMGKRCAKDDRLARLKETGGTAACEDAVVKGLRWLKANQNPDGSWGEANKPAMTGLALLAYFGHCETPSTMSEEFGDSCMKGVLYLINTGAANNGILAGSVASQNAPYEHGIATYALGEAATFCKDLKIEVPSLMEVTQKAGQFIIDNQHKNGGWAYAYATSEKAHTDSSVVGWQLQALKACSHTNIKYKGMNDAVDKGLEYLSGLQNENGSYGYNSKAARPGLTGVGVLCFQMWGKGKSSEARNGVKFIKQNFKLDWNTADSDLYSHYYASQAMMQAGGSNWSSYNKLFRDQLLNNQNADGSWKAPAFTGHGQTPGNAVYRNTLCILMLEVYYRFLNTSGTSRGERSGI